jgi:hypothetical protein
LNQAFAFLIDFPKSTPASDIFPFFSAAHSTSRQTNYQSVSAFSASRQMQKVFIVPRNEESSAFSSPSAIPKGKALYMRY